MAAFAKQGLRTCVLEIAGSDLTAWNVCGDGQHRCHTPMSIVQSINQMHVTRSATACTNSQFAGQLRFGPCGECCRFFMTIVNPLNFFVLTNLFGNARSEEHTSELQSLMRISYAVFCLK